MTTLTQPVVGELWRCRTSGRTVTIEVAGLTYATVSYPNGQFRSLSLLTLHQLYEATGVTT